jgi:hypothetical protein
LNGRGEVGEIKVPQRMCDEIGAYWPAKSEDEARRTLDIIKGVLTWQKVNPPVPTLEQFVEAEQSARREDSPSYAGFHIATIVEWVRRMYDESEPEVPEEIKDLLEGRKDGIVKAEVGSPIEEVRRRIIEAFRRGQKAGPK